MQFVEANYGRPILDDVKGLAGSPDGKHLYATGYWNGVIAVYSRDSLTGRLTLTETQRDGANGVDGLDSIMDAVVSHDGRSPYAVGDWDDGLSVFSCDSATGALTFVAVVQDGVDGVDGIYGAYAITISPDGDYLYVVGYLGTLAVFVRDSVSRDSTTGRLTFVRAFVDGTEGISGLAGPSDIAVSGDGARLYVSGWFDDSLVVFSREADTGMLTFKEAEPALEPDPGGGGGGGGGGGCFLTAFQDDALGRNGR